MLNRCLSCITTASLSAFRHLGLAVVLWLGLTLPARATHIVGGEMELRYKGGETYTLVLNLYFDAVHGNENALDERVLAGIFDKANGQRLQEVVLPLVENTFVNYTNPDCATATLSTRRLVYRQDITLPASVYNGLQGYYATVERCCRNEVISNIERPGEAAQAFYLEFPAVVRNGQPFLDSTPQIFPPLSDYACLNELFYYDFGGTDADGDSLIYDMVTPLNGHATRQFPIPGPSAAPYLPIVWKPGLSTQRQVPGNPTIQIEQHTGRLTVRPTQLGLFVFGVRCSEFRQGVKIGETRRDFQMLVIGCQPNTAPTAQVYLTGGPRPYVPGRDTLHLQPGQNRCVRVRFTDADPRSQLSVAARPVNFTTPLPAWVGAVGGMVRAAGSPDTLEATLCFSPCQDTQGKVFLLDIVVADNGCSLPKRDTVRLAFTATPPPNTPPELTSSIPRSDTTEPVVVRVPLGSVFTATLQGTDADNNGLVLTATGQGFDLRAAGMEFTAQNGLGQASGQFRWPATCEAAKLAEDLTVVFQLQEDAQCAAVPQRLPVRFLVVPVPDTVTFLPPNIITPNGDGLNDVFTLPDLPPDFCDARFADVKIFSRWGRQVYQSPERTFRWAGAGVAGSYFYLITYTNGRRFKGWLETRP